MELAALNVPYMWGNSQFQLQLLIKPEKHEPKIITCACSLELWNIKTLGILEADFWVIVTVHTREVVFQEITHITKFLKTNRKPNTKNAFTRAIFVWEYPIIAWKVNSEVWTTVYDYIALHD